MKVKLSLLLLVAALVPAAAFAQAGVAGKWVGELAAADGHGVAQPITVELKLDGQTLSGSVMEGALEARPIQSAELEGTTVTFRTVRNFGGSDINVNWKGEVSGDELKLTREIGPAPAEAGGGRGGGGRGGAGGGRGGAGARGAGGGRGGAPAAGGQRAAGGDVPAVPEAAAAGQRGAAAAAGGRGGGGRGGAAAGAGGAGGGGRGGGAAAPAAPAGPTVTLTLRRS